MRNSSRLNSATTVALLLGLAVSGIASAQNAEREVRTWTSSDRKFSIDGSFASFSENMVNLTKSNGQTLSVPVERLCSEDHQYIAEAADWGHVWRSGKGRVLHVAKFDSMIRGNKARLTTITGKTVAISLAALDKDSLAIMASILAEATRPGAPSTVQVPHDVGDSEKLIRQRIAECVRQSSRIRVDGNASDWQGLPTLTSNVATQDGSRDITRVGIAPRKSDLIVMIQTRERPTHDPFSFYIRVDFYGQRYGHDFQISVSNSSDQKIKVRDETNRGETIVDSSIGGVGVQIRDVIEVQIPYAVIASALPEKMRGHWVGQDARPFLRVETFSFDPRSRSIVEYGPSVASYRFVPFEYPLDEQAPANDRNVLPVAVPFQGKWIVGHGAMGYVTHLNIHAYDFYVLDHQGQVATTPQSPNNQDYYTFGLPIVSPIGGRILGLENDQPDEPPSQKEVKRANSVAMPVLGSDELQLHMLHFQQNSVEVEVGQTINAGDAVALAGNSGMTGFSHLHLELTKGRRPGPTERPTSPDETFTKPIAFEKAIVSLNPVPNDPWTRYVENWEIRSNVLVEATK